MDGVCVSAQQINLGIEREIVIMKLIEHPNVLRLTDVWETNHELFVFPLPSPSPPLSGSLAPAQLPRHGVRRRR